MVVFRSLRTIVHSNAPKGKTELRARPSEAEAITIDSPYRCRRDAAGIFQRARSARSISLSYHKTIACQPHNGDPAGFEMKRGSECPKEPRMQELNMQIKGEFDASRSRTSRVDSSQPFLDHTCWILSLVVDAEIPSTPDEW
jgi:hypothetical protein